MIKKNVLVTGGAGYIGSHTCKALSRAGYTPVTLDNLVYGNKRAVKWGPLEIGDILDSRLVDQVVQTYDPLGVIHFAAFAYVGESMENPAKYYYNNVTGALSLFEGLRKNNIDNIVFSSTCATYGVPVSIPIKETHPQTPINPYGKSKAMVEQILKDYESAYGMSFLALRYFNAAGADHDGDIGEEHDPETHLIPLVIKAALGQIPQVDIYGSDYPTPDGTAVRDYIHVSDLAQAHVQALEYLLNGGKSDYLNLGTGKGNSVLDIIKSVERVSLCEVPYVCKSRRQGDPPELVAHAEKAKIVLGWNPEFINIDDSVQTAWDWHKKIKLNDIK